MCSLKERIQPFFPLANLKAMRKSEGLTQEQVAKDLDIPLSTYRNWEQQKNAPTSENLLRLAGYFGCTVSDFVFVGSDPHNPEYKMVDVPLFGSIAAGTPLTMEDPYDMADEQFPIPQKLQDKYGSCFLLKVKGDSMNRVIPNGSYALIKPADEIVHDGAPYALCVNGHDATIKRVHQLNNGFELIPDSTDPTYQTKTYNYNDPDTETITIIGEVVYYVLPYDWSF